jgi:hypothetical protein
MSAESLGHIFIFIGIISTWLFPLWLYFHWLRNDDEILIDYITAIAYSGVYFTLIAHYFKFTVSISV